MIMDQSIDIMGFDSSYSMPKSGPTNKNPTGPTLVK